MTGEGLTPVACQRAIRSSVQIRAFGFVPGRSSTCSAGLKGDITCWVIATFRAALSVALMCGWALRLVIRRNGGIASNWALNDPRRARFSAPLFGGALSSSWTALDRPEQGIRACGAAEAGWSSLRTTGV